MEQSIRQSFPKTPFSSLSFVVMILFSLSISVFIALTPKVSGSFVCCPEHATKVKVQTNIHNAIIILFIINSSKFIDIKLAGGEQHFMLFADGKSTRDSRISGARECSSLDGTKWRNILGRAVFFCWLGMKLRRTHILPIGEYRSAPFSS